MIDVGGQAILQDILRRESRSLLQYVSEAFPWTTPAERATLASLQELIEEERREAAALGQFLVRQRIDLPQLGSYPLSFTTTNYVSLDHLLPMLVEHEQRALEELQADLPKLAGSDAQPVVRRILETKRRHLQTLQSMAATPAVAVAH